jgi:hypothetical protein
MQEFEKEMAIMKEQLKKQADQIKWEKLIKVVGFLWDLHIICTRAKTNYCYN